jgi:hypothetical protein
VVMRGEIYDVRTCLHSSSPVSRSMLFALNSSRNSSALELLLRKVRLRIELKEKIAYCTAITKNKLDLAYLFKYMKDSQI